MKFNKFITSSLLGLSVFAVAPFALAQVIASPAYPIYPPVQQYCPQLSYNLYIGLTDSYAAGQVTQLQQFLSTRYSQPVTGYFGAITRANVAQFQREQGIYPVTGGVGPLTRAAIARICGGQVYNGGGVSITNVIGPNSLAVGQQGTWSITTSAPTNSNISVSVRWGDEYLYGYGNALAPQSSTIYQQNSFTHSYSSAGTYTITFTVTDGYGATNSSGATVTVGSNNGCTNYNCDSQVSITTLSPAQGGVGTQVAIYGSGFTQDNRVHFGVGGAIHVPSYNNGTLLYFTIPTAVGPCSWAGDTSPIRCLVADQQVMPGVYQISVENINGVSGSLGFTVTNVNTNSAITVTSPVSGSQYQNGTVMPIAWTSSNTPSGNSAVVLDLYTNQGSKVGTIAISNNASGSYSWSVPRVPNNLFCTMQYPNGLCGTALSGQYYIKASLVSGSGFDTNATIYSSATSGVFTIY
jgi:peptidoglycan hydrolase-like protein with peptidoglycan-binding domain